ncbi:MAG: trypsin-like peptidase domain-containing protein [Actinomycetia bacterium]|nr:trypsin-like peptidase domain-containing protein [Actinomycetes bacterium]MCH9737088.1 trypsin-like peptidase domain-containing protein [Actinomycetes bacterium]
MRLIAATRIASTAAAAVLVAGCVTSGPPRLSEDRLKSSAVLIESSLCDGAASGSGFFISATELVTNRHVVAATTGVRVQTADGRTLTVGEILLSRRIDAAVLRLTEAAGRPLLLGADPAPGDAAWIVGYPQGGPVRVTTGRVVDEIDGSRFHQPGTLIRTRAEADPGNSGGPLLNSRGEVMGLVTAVEYDSGWTLAIPVSDLAQALPKMDTAPPAAQC